MTDQFQFEVSRDAEHAPWTRRRALTVLSAAWLVASLAHVLLTLGAYAVLEAIVRDMAGWSGSRSLAAAFALAGMLWLCVLMVWRYLTPAGHEPEDDAGFVATPLLIVFAAVFLQFGLLLWVAQRSGVPGIIAVSGVLSMIPIARIVHDCVRPHIPPWTPPSYSTRRA